MTTSMYGYIRVSTAKQGLGVSLQEQKDAILRYAEKNSFVIVEWFEELQTAAKRGRPIFSGMMKKLRKQVVKGVVMHKIDRGARNLKDWADIGELIDQGVEVHFAHESLDLMGRGGRLAADIQAVVSADYVRNLRDEAIKGIYGRLKQGIYPFRAPLGYLDNGKAKAKTVDPLKGPLVRKAFQLYATQRYSLRRLVNKLDKLGLKNLRDQKLYVTNLSKILRNPFYMGLITVKGEYYKGIHEPLVSKKTFQAVQDILDGKDRKKSISHEFLFRSMVRCLGCGQPMYGETQKSNKYYRCQTKECATKCIREDHLVKKVWQRFQAVQFLPVEIAMLKQELSRMEGDSEKVILEHLASMELQLQSLRSRLDRLTDVYLDGVMDQEGYLEKRKSLLIEITGKEATYTELLTEKEEVFRKVANFLELGKSLIKSFETALFENKQRLVKIAVSNLAVKEKELVITMVSPFEELKIAQSVCYGGLTRDTTRLQDRKVASDGDEEIIQRKPMSRKQLKNFLNYLIAHPEILPELPNEDTTHD